MDVDGFIGSLSFLKGATVQASDWDAPADPGAASVLMQFSSGATLRVDYWRTVIRQSAGISSFDHGQQYGLTAPIDAFAELNRELANNPVTQARWESETGDLVLAFHNGTEFRAFNLTAYEVWELRFPDGTVEYSNYRR